MIRDALSFPIDAVRGRFPALAVRDEGRPRIYFDAPGGTQACADAIVAMAAHLSGGTANAGGAFTTSVATDAMSAEAHAAMADLLGGSPEEIAFGPNITTLTLLTVRHDRPGPDIRLYGRGTRPCRGRPALGHARIFAWSGHFYAVETIAALGLSDAGGLVRVGLCHYNSVDEIDALLAALSELVGS